VRQTVTVKKNVAAVRVVCPAGGQCAGTLALASGKVKVGSARYSVAAGQRATVRIKLSRTARKLIARKRKLTATATAQQSRAAITLKLPKRRR
jgi:invasion protein IalB